jgi:redox-sensitive bicupin YhaK (pirin superfamily)
MSNIIIHKADSRGHADHGWLKANHSFSFANYYDPERVHFGVLRVLNDDYVEGGQGFPMHPHDNMEIITIPLEGALEHKDSMGNKEVVRAGEIQVMSAGTGIYHSEYNHYKDKALKLFQIWLMPNKRNVTPRYDQMLLDVNQRRNKLQQILSPSADDEGVWIHQDAWFFLGTFDEGVNTTHTVKRQGNGVYIMVVNGKFEINGTVLEQRDAIGLSDINEINIKSLSQDAEILVMDLPMHLN